MDSAVRKYIARITSAGGRARAANLTPEERSEIARKGGEQRARNFAAKRAEAAAAARKPRKRKPL